MIFSHLYSYHDKIIIDPDGYSEASINNIYIFDTTPATTIPRPCHGGPVNLFVYRGPCISVNKEVSN